MFIQRGAASDVKPTGGRPRSNLPDRSQIKKPRPAFPKLRERQERGVIDSGSSGGRGRRFRLHAAGCHEGQRYRGEHLHAELDCHAERSDAVRRFQHDKASGAEPNRCGPVHGFLDEKPGLAVRRRDSCLNPVAALGARCSHEPYWDGRCQDDRYCGPNYQGAVRRDPWSGLRQVDSLDGLPPGGNRGRAPRRDRGNLRGARWPQLPDGRDSRTPGIPDYRERRARGPFVSG